MSNYGASSLRAALDDAIDERVRELREQMNLAIVGAGLIALEYYNTYEHIDEEPSSRTKRKDKQTVMNKKRRSGATALADSINSLVQAVKVQSKEICVRHDNSNGPSVGECVAKLVSIPDFSPVDPLIMFGVALMDNANNREILMALPTVESILGWLRAKMRVTPTT